MVRCHQSKINVDCKKGCKYCCYQSVYASVHEVLMLKNYIMNNFEAEEIDEIIKKAKAKSEASRINKEKGDNKISHPCPLLIDGVCSVYSARPMACRIYMSSDVNSCIQRYDLQDDEKSFPALFEFLLVAGRNMNSGFGSKLDGLSYHVLEGSLEELLYKALSDPEFEKTWWDKKKV